MASSTKDPPAVPSFLTMDPTYVTIHVGTPAVHLVVHKEVICHVSKHFKKAFNGEFKEAEESSLDLPAVKEKTFRTFLQWAYAQVHISQPKRMTFAERIAKEAELEDESMKNKDKISKNPISAGGSTSHLPQQVASGTIDYDDEDVISVNWNVPGPADDDSSPISELIFDENHPGNLVKSAKGESASRLYHQNETWLSNYNKMIMALLELYIFADAHEVDQLRDDILTAFVGYVFAYDWWPEPDHDIIDTSFDNLPSSSQWIRLLVVSYAYTWDPKKYSKAEMENLKSCNPEFLFELFLAQTQRCDNFISPEKSKDLPSYMLDGIPNSCAFHEHNILNRANCRERLASNPHIFSTLIEACTPK